MLDQLRAALRSGQPPDSIPDRPRSEDIGPQAVWRLLQAWHQARAWGPDQAVLLRQVARWWPNLAVGALAHELSGVARQAGVHVPPSGELMAEPYQPGWLLNDHAGAFGLDGPPEVRRPQEAVRAEPWLRALGFQTWHSAAQKEAAWTVLSAPRRSTTLVALPTGAGKSLCFQLLAKTSPGLTVVVVPTVALALDQCEQALAILKDVPGVNPVCFSADEAADDVVERVRSRGTRLVFTSPEACVTGRLHSVLEQAASDGWLENLVVDEAHIIETWGVYFRVDFQFLSMLWTRWMSRPDCHIRTYLLSATFTPEGKELLRRLFWREGHVWREAISPRLRPELTYYTREFETDGARNEAVLECLWRLPRPAILYVTAPEDAEEWGSRLRVAGFSRLAVFHGGTGSVERREILKAWRRDDLDLIVATAAFGMGVDKQDVRTVLHACLPENLHRYYQEVGRAGRDGRSAIAALLVSPRDRRAALELAPTLMGDDKSQGRWDAMWRTAQHVSTSPVRVKVRPDARPVYLSGKKTYDEHIRWNKRLLLQLRRAGLIELHGLEFQRVPDGILEGGEKGVEWIDIEVRFNAITPNLGGLLHEIREQELRTFRAGFDQMEEALRTTRCLGRILCRVYGLDLLDRVCGGCSSCRREKRAFYCPPLPVPEREAPVATILMIAGLTDPSLHSEEPRWRKVLRELMGRGIVRFACAPNAHQRICELLERADTTGHRLYRVDSVEEEPRFEVAPDESLAVIHAGTLHEPALRLRRGRELLHLLATEPSPPLDAHKRYPLEAQGVSLLTYENWLNVH